MIEQNEKTEPKTVANAESFEEYKKLRTAPPAEKVEKAAPPVAETQESPTSGENEVSESAPVSETGKSTQEPKKRSANARFKELTDARKAAESRAEKAERELEELRKGTRSPEATAAPKAETKPAESATDDFPGFEAFFQEAVKDPANTTWDKAQAAAMKQYNKAVLEHYDKTRKADAEKSEAEKRQAEAKTAHEAKLAKAREKHADFNDVLQAAIDQTKGVVNQGIDAAMTHSENTGDLLYYFSTHLDEYRHIAAMTPEQAYRATVLLEIKMNGDTPSAPPEPRQKPQSRVPAPPTPVAATSGRPQPKSLAEASSFEEYKRLRAAK